MTTEEKIRYFMDSSIEDTSAKSDRILSQYKQSLDEEFERYKISAAKEGEFLKKSKINSAKQQLRKAFAKEQMEIKRKITDKQNQIKANIFASVSAKIEEYRKIPEYVESLKNQINKISSDFAESDIVFYISTEDASLIDELKESTNVNITISEVSFTGGIKAVIPSRNMLIDLSFKTKLMEADEQFTITI